MLKNYRIVVAVVVCVIFQICSGSLPSNINKCKISDHVCIAKSINDVIRLYPKGNPSFGFVDISEIKRPKIILSEDKNRQKSSLGLNLIVENAVLYGLENAKVTSVSGFDPNISKITLTADVMNLRLTGDYNVNGNILLLQLKGKGKGEIKSKRTTFKATVDVRVEKRNGKNYLAINRIKMDIQPHDLHVSLDNLFDGNKELTESLNETINKNWRDFWMELRDLANDALADLSRGILESAFNHLSYDDFYVN
uniref:Uncharacterized protein n=1 Tax=Glossina pallidipes TaxID=7398 RepID=A0A1A9ZDH0_GLOPL